MSDLISREAAIALAKDICVPTKDGTVYKHRYIDPDDIKELPSAEPEQSMGKWITKHPYRDDFGREAQLDLRFRFPSCSNCGAVFGCTPYYCPNCGFKMRNGTEWLDWDTGYGVQKGEEDE